MPELKPCPFCWVMPTLNESRYTESEYLASVSCRCVNDDIAESYFLRSGKTQVEASARRTRQETRTFAISGFRPVRFKRTEKNAG